MKTVIGARNSYETTSKNAITIKEACTVTISTRSYVDE
jgi:hypothetical protein